MTANLRGVGIVASVAAALLLAGRVDGHAHQQYPISRQYSLSRDFFFNEDKLNEGVLEGTPYAYHAGSVGVIRERSRENIDPDVLEAHGGSDAMNYPLYYGEFAENGNYLESNEINKRASPCGDPIWVGRVLYTIPNSEWNVLHTLESGQEIEIEVVIRYHHKGHFEYFICDTQDLDDPDGVVDQECLNKHPLNRAYNKNDASTIDPNYPGRYYLDPPCRRDEVEQNVSNTFGAEDSQSVKMRYTLPDIECEHCVLQMHWHNGRDCQHIGYDEFDPTWNSECAPNTEDWINTGDGVRTCGVANAYPQEFWQCSDIALTKAVVDVGDETPGSTDEETAEPTPTHSANEETAEPEPTPVPASPGSVTRQHLGCFKDNKEDRVLKHYVDSDMMTTDYCCGFCLEEGDNFCATQFGEECWCSDEVNLLHDRHGDGAACDYPCPGNEAETEMCGGFDAFDLYLLTDPPMEEECMLPDEQCGGEGHNGSTCCTEGHMCTVMGSDSSYSQCRPIDDYGATTPSPVGIAEPAMPVAPPA